MSDHILKLLHDRKERSLKRKEGFKKMKVEEFENKTASVKRILGGGNQYSAVPVQLTVLRDLYFSMFRAYTGKVQYYSPEMTDGQVALWMRVEKAREQTDCDPERFMKAQFSFFNQAFGTTPTPVQLTTDSAVERARDFEGSTEGKILGNVRKAPITQAETFRAAEKTFQKIMAAQGMTRLEAYKKLILTGVFMLPKEFIEADPVYRQALEDNE